MKTLSDKKFLLLALLLSAFLASFFLIYAAQAASRDSSISLKKDGDLFILAISDPDGVNYFDLQPPVGSNYSGGVPGCPTIFNSKNVAFRDPGDFEPAMKAFITDCKKNVLEFELLPPKDGITRGKLAVPEAEAKEAAPAVTTTVKVEEKPAPKPTRSLEDVQYPVKELGGCASEEACKTYCDDRSHADACLSFAKDHGLMSEEDYDYAQRFKNIDGGPGGCRSRNACETYCDDTKNLDECIAFAETNDVLPPEELASAKKFQQILKAGGKTPGGCNGRQSCETYCTSGEHIEECIAFGEKTGFLKGEELTQARKFMEIMRSGGTPGGCRGREQCEVYCEDENHLDECMAFVEKAGFATPEEIEMFKKTGGKGPGGCKSKAQCESYCEANQEECFNWANEHGLLKEEDLAQMRDGLKQFREQFENMPPEVVECFKETIGEEKLNKILNGEPVFDRELGDKMQSCFEELAGSFGGPGGPGGFSGPGGCSSQEECQAYCEENPEDCEGFAPPGGGGPGGGGFSGPGGCSSQEECTNFCLENLEACKNFTGGGGNGDGGFPGGPGSSDGGFPGDPGNGFPSSPGGGSGGPGGCTSQEQCQAYCQEHPAECGGGGNGGELPQDYQQQYPSTEPTPTGTTHDAVRSAEIQKQYEEQYQQQYERQYQEQSQQQLPAAPNQSFLGRAIDSLLNLFR